MGLVKKEKGKNWYYQFEYTDIDGKKHTKSVNTQVPKEHTSTREKSRANQIGIKLKEQFLRELENEKLRIQGLTSDIDYSLYKIKDYSEHWLEDIKYEIRDSTATSYRQELKAHIIPILGEFILKDINTNTIKYFFETEFEDCLDKLEKNEPNYMQSIRKHLNTLSTMLDFAVSENAITFNPVSPIKKRLLKKLNQYKTVHKTVPYSWDELMNLQEIILREDTHIEPAVIIVIWTGIRKEEVLGLRWQDIDLEKKQIHIRNTCTKVGSKIVYAEKTKTEHSRRTIPMANDLHTYLLSLKKIQEQNKEFFGEGYIDTDLICVWNNGKPIKPDNLSRTFKRILVRNSLRLIRFYDLRHSFGSVLFNTTGDIKTVSDFLGHTNISTTSDIYVTTNEEHKKEALDNLQHK